MLKATNQRHFNEMAQCIKGNLTKNIPFMACYVISWIKNEIAAECWKGHKFWSHSSSKPVLLMVFLMTSKSVKSSNHHNLSQQKDSGSLHHLLSRSECKWHLTANTSTRLKGSNARLVWSPLKIIQINSWPSASVFA